MPGYVAKAWADGIAGNTPIQAVDLNHLEQGVAAGDVTNPASAAGVAMDGRFATGGEVRSKSKADGTDQTAIIQAEFDALCAGAGGTLVLPVSGFGAIPVKVSKLTLASTGTTPAKQPSIQLRGQGAHWSGRGTAPLGGTILEFTGTDSYGLLKTNGLGLLGIEGITFLNTGAGTTPFIYTTNTTLNIEWCSFVGSKQGVLCDQDGIVLGGVNQVEGGSGWTDGFQGYGTVISRNFFSGIRTCIKGQAFANAVVVRDNTVWTTCGNPNGAAIDWNGLPTTGTQYAAGGVIEGNLIEVPNYKYAISLTKCAGFTLSANNVFDSTATTTAGVIIDATSTGNTVREGFTAAGLTPIVDNGTFNWFTASTQGRYSTQPPTNFSDINLPTILRRALVNAQSRQFAVQPIATQSDFSTLLLLQRSAAEATNPGVDIFDFRQNAALVVRGAQAGNVTYQDAAGVDFTTWTGGGRAWAAAGVGSGMSQNSGTGGSYFDMRNYGVRFYDHNAGPLRVRIGAGKDGLDFGAASDATVQRAAAGVVSVGKLAVTNSVAAATPGAVTKKIEVFDGAGLSLGFVAVYSSIA